MYLSAEIRCFWRDELPEGLFEWFCEEREGRCAAGGGKQREDVYLRDPHQEEVGIKRRAGKPGLEIKSLVATWDSFAAPRLRQPIQIWVKTSSQYVLLPDDATIRTKKTRRLRTFDLSGDRPREIPLGEGEQPLDPSQDLPERGCDVELTKVEAEGQTWWTYAFEAFGDLSTVEHDLVRTADEMAARHPPSLGTPLAASYPAWLRLFVQGD